MNFRKKEYLKMDILYTRGDNHECIIEDHVENPERVAKAIDYFNNYYNNITSTVTSINYRLISDIIKRVHGETFFLKFAVPYNILLTCFECKHTFMNSDFCTNCNSKNFQWKVTCDTYVTKRSVDAIFECMAVLFKALDNIIDGKRYQYCIVRPPGHHCFNKSQGYCHTNNVFVLSEYAILRGYERVLILDYDYHFADGTYELMKCMNNNRLVIDIHAYSSRQGLIFPGGGSEQDNTEHFVNIPLNHNIKSDRRLYTDRRCKEIFNVKVLPLISNYSPDIILISNGLDGHINDKIAGLSLSEQFYSHVTRELKRFNVPLIYCLEGGYNPNTVLSCSKEIIETLIN